MRRPIERGEETAAVIVDEVLGGKLGDGVDADLFQKPFAIRPSIVEVFKIILGNALELPKEEAVLGKDRRQELRQGTAIDGEKPTTPALFDLLSF